MGVAALSPSPTPSAQPAQRPRHEGAVRPRDTQAAWTRLRTLRRSHHPPRPRGVGGAPPQTVPGAGRYDPNNLLTSACWIVRLFVDRLLLLAACRTTAQFTVANALPLAERWPSAGWLLRLPVGFGGRARRRP